MKGSADIEFLASLEQDINQSLAILVAAEKGECSLNNDFDVEDILGADIDYEEEIRKMMPVDLLDDPTCSAEHLERLFEEEEKQKKQQQSLKKATASRRPLKTKDRSRNISITSGRSQVGENNDNFKEFKEFNRNGEQLGKRKRAQQEHQPDESRHNISKTLPKRNRITSPDDLSNAIVYLTARFDLLKITTQPPAVSIPSATDDIVLPSPPTNSKSNRPRFRRLKVMGRTCLVTKSDR